jgi:hypothetical protein
VLLPPFPCGFRLKLKKLNIITMQPAKCLVWDEEAPWLKVKDVIIRCYCTPLGVVIKYWAIVEWCLAGKNQGNWSGGDTFHCQFSTTNHIWCPPRSENGLLLWEARSNHLSNGMSEMTLQDIHLWNLNRQKKIHVIMQWVYFLYYLSMMQTFSYNW